MTSPKPKVNRGLYTFERFNGWLVYIPWGLGFIWYGLPSKELLLQYSLFHERFGYNYGMISLGLVLVIWGLRKGTVNRVKQQAKIEAALPVVKQEMRDKGQL